MNQEIQDKLEQMCQMIFTPCQMDHTVTRRMGGLTNFNYHVKVNDKEYALRIPGEGTEELIHRGHEYVHTKLADELGIDAGLVYFDKKDGTKVMNYIVHGETMSPKTMKQRENLKLTADIFRTLHHCGIDTGVPFDVFAMAKEYEAIIVKHHIPFYDDYQEVKSAISNFQKEMASYAISSVPCHNDPLCENLIKSDGRMFLIDWEYAGMNDPMWDLADVSIEAGLDEKLDQYFLHAYTGGQPSYELIRRFEINKVYLDFLWCLWGLTRAPYDDSLFAYAKARYERAKQNCKKLMEP